MVGSWARRVLQMLRMCLVRELELLMIMMMSLLMMC